MKIDDKAHVRHLPSPSALGMLVSLGIEKGKPYESDHEDSKAMKAAVAGAFFYRKEKFVKGESDELYWEDRQWLWTLYADPNQEFT